jgi:hypothetical protein
VKAGDTILIPLPGTSLDSHLWMVLSDPDANGECVLVNFTSWRADKDQACVVEVEEHPYVTRKTCVNYRDAKICKAADLDALIAASKLRNHSALSPALLVRILSAVAKSHMNWNCVQRLASQGLLPDDE